MLCNIFLFYLSSCFIFFCFVRLFVLLFPFHKRLVVFFCCGFFFIYFFYLEYFRSYYCVFNASNLTKIIMLQIGHNSNNVLGNAMQRTLRACIGLL